MKNQKLILSYFMCLFILINVPTALCTENKAVGELVVTDLLMNSGIPSDLYMSNDIDSICDTVLQYNASSGCAEFIADSSHYNGKMYAVGFLPATTCNYTYVLSYDSDSSASNLYIDTSNMRITVLRLSDVMYRVIGNWYNDNDGQEFPYFDIPVSALDDGKLVVHASCDGVNRTNTIWFNSTLSMSVPYVDKAQRNVPYTYVIHPVITFSNYMSDASSVTTRIYSIRQTVPRYNVTATGTRNFTAFGIDYPNPVGNTNGTSYMHANGQRGVAWVDLGHTTPEDIAFTNHLLNDYGWELGIHFTGALTSLDNSSACEMIDDEVAHVTSIFDRAPTSWCSLTNADNITHAIYAYNKHNMLWRNGPTGISAIPNIGNLDRNTWFWWNTSIRSGVIFPAFTHSTDADPNSEYSIDYSKFLMYSDAYRDNSINVVGFCEYYLTNANQKDAAITILENNTSQIKFTVNTNGYPVNLNVKTPIVSPYVYQDENEITYNSTGDGVEFVAIDGAEYLISDTPIEDNPPIVLPVANFTANTTEGIAPLSVQFTDLSENTTGYYWDFGDGSSSTEESPFHEFVIPGIYTVNLTAINVNGTDSKTATITVNEAILPVANFSTNVSEGIAPLTVQFTDLSVNADTVAWDFNNDGTTDSTDRNPIHVFSTVGTYTVNLTAINGNGTGSKTATITVNSVLTPPVADFTANTTEGYAPLTVQFTDTSTNNPTEWSWEFGDGDSSIEQNPEHTFLTEGVYTVNLTARNGDGTDEKTAIITVLNENKVLPVADFSMSVTAGYAPLPVTFTDLSQNATSRIWDFGDGATSTKQNPKHVYTAAGTYTVKLTSINANGTGSKIATITVDKKQRGKSSNSNNNGGSPEPAKNVEVKELSQVFITNGKTEKFDFIKNATCVVYVSFDAKKNAGKTTTTVEELKDKSLLVSGLPEGEVYKYFNVWVGNSGYVSSNNIENPALCFKVEKAWIQDKNIDQDSITLNMYSDTKWEQLPASFLSEDDRYLYFRSSVSGYSFFAITGNTADEETNQVEYLITPKPEKGKNKQNNVKPEVPQTFEGDKRDISGFEMIYCIIGLLGVFLCREGRLK